MRYRQTCPFSKQSTVGEVSANVTVEVNCNPQAVTLPDKDFSTNLIVKIDDNNILYAQLNLLENMYRFKLGELNILYSNNVFKVQKGQDIRVMGDISVISEIVQRIDDIVKQFADPPHIVANRRRCLPFPWT